MNRHAFCRGVLRAIRAELTIEQQKRVNGSWSYMYQDGTGEFHIPNDDFYWYGSADCAYDARVQGILAWIREFYPDFRGVASHGK